MTDDFENLSLGNEKLKANDLNGAMYHYHSIFKKNKNNVQLYLNNFDLFCKNKITKQKYFYDYFDDFENL